MTVTVQSLGNPLRDAGVAQYARNIWAMLRRRGSRHCGRRREQGEEKER